MAVSSPPPNIDRFVVPTGRYVVWLGEDGGEPPTESDEVDFLELMSLQVTAGGSRVDALQFRYNLKKADQRLQDVGVPVSYQRQVEVRRLDEDDEPTIVVAWGFIAEITETVGQSETLDVTARLDAFIFGDRLEQTRYWDEDLQAVVELRQPVTLNPRIDDQILGNRSDFRDSERDNAYLLVDPESLRTPDARMLQGMSDGAQRWSVAEAVHAFCWTCNPDETYLKNPKLEDLRELLREVVETEFHNIELPYAATLPEILDLLLGPIGYGWFLKHSLNDDDERQTELEFYERGVGETVEVLMQRVGEQLDARETTVHDLRATIDIASLANRIVVRGGLKRYELTVRLRPGWPSDEDDTTLSEATTDEAVQRERPNVARKFVLNEAGDYTAPFRDDIAAFYDLRDWLGGAGAPPDSVLIKRRRFHPCLSRANERDEAESLGYVLEWWDRDAAGAETPDEQTDHGWTRVKSGYSVLEKECGVLFHEPELRFWRLHREGLDTPPEGLTHPGLFLRMTACIDADARLEAIAGRDSESPQGAELTLTLDHADRFHYRQVHATSRFYGDRSQADQADDTDDITAYAERVREIEDVAKVGCSMKMIGELHPELKIGCLIEKLGGRELALNARTGDNPRPLQIVGYTLQLQPNPAMELMLETFQAERPAL